jgi:hypothetical protein
VSISDVRRFEGNAGVTTDTFVVSLNAVALAPVTVSYATGDGTAKAALDFLSAGGTVTIPAGASSATALVSVVGDTLRETNEAFVVNLSNPSPNAYIADGQGVGMILNDD